MPAASPSLHCSVARIGIPEPRNGSTFGSAEPLCSAVTVANSDRLIITIGWPHRQQTLNGCENESDPWLQSITASNIAMPSGLNGRQVDNPVGYILQTSRRCCCIHARCAVLLPTVKPPFFVRVSCLERSHQTQATAAAACGTAATRCEQALISLVAVLRGQAEGRPTWHEQIPCLLNSWTRLRAC